MAAFSPSRAPLCHHLQRHPRTQAVAQHPQAALSWQPPEHSSPATNANSTRVSDGGLLPHHKNYKRGGQGGLISPRNRLERALSPHQEPRPHRFSPEITSPRPMRMPPAANRSEPGLHAILSTHRLERLKTPAASSGAPLPALHPTAGAVPATAVDTPRSAHVNRTLRKQDHRIPAAPPVCGTPLAPTPQGAGLRRRSTDLRADPGMLSGWQACRLAEAATAADATCRDGATFRQYYSQRFNRAPLCTTLACLSSPPLPASASVPALSGGASWASRWAKGPKRLPQGSWAALPCGSRFSAGGSPSTSTRPLVMRGEGGGGGATSLGHADGQANRSFMAREG